MAEKDQADFWDFKQYSEKRWFRFLAIEFLILALLYVGTHMLNKDKNGYEYARLNPDQIQFINRVYFDTTTIVSHIGQPQPSQTGKPIAVGTTNNSKHDTAKGKKPVAPGSSTGKDTTQKDGKAGFKGTEKDTTKKQAVPGHPISSNSQHLAAAYKSETDEKVILYLRNEFNNKIDTAQLDSIKKFLRKAKPFESINALVGTRYQTRSYFWLTGPCVYFEIIFWALFGVISSLQFSLGVVGKNSTTDANNPRSVFDSSEIPYQVAKMFYAPACALVVILGYNYFKDPNMVDISSSKGVIVIAFVAGFYSSRVVAFLDRLKDLLLPNSGTAELSDNKQVSTASNPTKPIPALIISLQIDPAATSPELEEIKKAGLNEAIVKMQSVNSHVMLTGSRKDSDQPSNFVFEQVLPGIYKITAEYERTVGGNLVKLAGDKTTQVSLTDKLIPLIMKQA